MRVKFALKFTFSCWHLFLVTFVCACCDSGCRTQYNDWATGWRTWVRIPPAKIFFCSPKRPDFSGGHPVSWSTSTGVLSWGKQSGRCVKFIAHLLMRRLRISGAVPLFPAFAIMTSCNRKQSSSIDHKVRFKC